MNPFPKASEIGGFLVLNDLMENTFDAKQAELNESQNLIERGVEFTTPKKSILKYFSKQKERKFVIRQPYIGALDLMCYEFLQTEIDEDLLQGDPLSEAKKLSHKSVKRLAAIVAIAVLDSWWKIKLFKDVLTTYFLWRITPKKLLEISLIINQMCNFSDFINSTRLMSVTKTTTPTPVEEKQKAYKALTEREGQFVPISDGVIST